jgi:hypothetical protein
MINLKLNQFSKAFSFFDLHLLKSAGISGLNLRGGICAWYRFAQSAHAQAESGISP